jgi:hypothetical protein
MPTLSQKNKPIMFLLQGGGPFIPFVFGVPIVGAIRPEQYQLTRAGRGAVTQTEGGAFLDEFGEGPAQLMIAGHTGWGAGYELPGVIKVKALEAIFIEYLRRYQRLKEANADPSIVQLWFLDSLNLEAFSVYPMQFSLERNKGRPLLYYYRMQFIVLVDLLQDAVYKGIDAITASMSG